MTTAFALLESEASTTEVAHHLPPDRSPGWRPRLVAEGDDAAPLELEHAQRILEAAADLLRQGEELLGTVSAEAYARKLPVAFNGSMGGHYRHCLDHFTSVLRGLDADLVDYDHRERDARIEREPEFARELTRRMRQSLAALEPHILALPVAARCEVSYDHGRSPVTRSTVARELVYAIAHGIHHYALIAVMARLMNAELPPHFGVAPSTLAHQQAAAHH